MQHRTTFAGHPRAVRRFAAAASLALAALAAGAPAASPPPVLAAGARCDVPAAAIPAAGAQRTLHRFLDGLGNRPTGSPAQQAYIRWIERRLERIPGMQIRTLGYPIRRWDAGRASLRVGSAATPVAGPVPYSGGTSAAGVTAALVAIPGEQPITAANAAGRIVVRPAPAGVVPLAAFTSSVLGWSAYDPDGVFASGGEYRRDFLNYDPRLRDLLAADAAGAAGILFAKDRPRAQIRDHTEPYEGLRYRTPGLFLGADEGAAAAAAAAAGASATIVLPVTTKRVITRTLLATLPGRGAQRIVVDSHTDGTNVVEDNGPIAMTEMAAALARLPRSCRARTVQFAFSTAHFYQRVSGKPKVRDGGAEQVARQLDRDYDKGTVAGVVVLEHLGARQYDVVPRSDGPGTRLVLTSRPEPTLVAVSDSRPLIAATAALVRRYRLRSTALLQGADAKGDHVPAHCSFGGEGTPYNHHLLPTVATIAAPATLYDPHWGLDGIDFARMRDQTLAFTQLVRRMDGMSRSAIAGQLTADRQARARGAPTCPWPY
jgi:hypothetical protein